MTDASSITQTIVINAATGPVVPFIPVIAKQLGYSAAYVGTIYFFLPIIGLIAKPLFGACGDKLKIHKALFLTFQLATAVSFLGILFIPPEPAPSEFHCHGGESTMQFCPDGVQNMSACTLQKLLHDTRNTSFMCTMNCEKNEQWPSICPSWHVENLCESTAEKVIIDVKVQRNHIVHDIKEDCFWFIFHNGTIGGDFSHLYCPAEEHSETFAVFKMDCEILCDDPFINEAIIGATDGNSKLSANFVVFVLLLGFSWLGMAVVVSIGDAICVGMIQRNTASYGHQRVWGAVGWGSFSLLTGILIDYFSRHKTSKDYSIGFYLMAGLIIFDFIVSTQLKHEQANKSKTMMRDLSALFKSVRVVVFFVWCIVAGLGCAMVWNFLFWHVESIANCQATNISTLLGVLMFVQCFAGEVPFFFYSGWILQKFGHVNVMSAVLAGYAIRFTFYAYLTDPWWFIPVEVLNGLTFGLFYSTMTSYAAIIAPAGTDATLQVK